MAPDNTEIARRAYEAFNSGDQVEWLRHADPAIDYRVFGVPESGAYQGREGLQDYVEGIMDGWDEMRIETEEFFEIDETHVLVLGRQVSTGASTGINVEGPFAAFGEFCDGLCVSVRHYHGMGKAEALEAAGLDEAQQV